LFILLRPLASLFTPCVLVFFSFLIKSLFTYKKNPLLNMNND
jgi:hypothetical protein